MDKGPAQPPKIQQITPEPAGDDLLLHTETLSPPVKREATAMIDLLRDSGSLAAAKDVLSMGVASLDGFRRLDSNNFTYEGFKFALTLGMYAEREAKALKVTDMLNVAAAPRFIDHLQFGDGESMLITRTAGCEKEGPVSLVKWSRSVDPAAKERFIDDMDRLASRGYFHPFAPKGYHHWEINPGNGSIMLNSWSQLAGIDPENINKLQRRLRQLVDRIPG